MPTKTPARTTRPRKTAAAAPAAERPLVDLTEDAHDPDAVERVLLFELGGVEYRIPAQNRAGLIHDYVDVERREGADDAMWWLLTELLGEDGVRALRSYEGLTKSHLRKIQMACIDTLMGPKA